MSLDKTYRKIEFKSGEIAWIKYELDDLLFLIFQDLTSAPRYRKSLPEYEVISTPEKKEDEIQNR